MDPISPQSGDSKKIDTARKELEATRAEVNVRMQQRDNALFAYLTGVGVLGGIALSTTPKLNVLLIVPYISVAVAAIVSQHHTVIGRREAFIATRLMPFLRQLHADAPFKEGTQQGEYYNQHDIVLRTVAHAISLVLPAVIASALNRGMLCEARGQWAWWAAIISLLATSAFIWASHRSRQRSAREIEQATYGVCASEA